MTYELNRDDILNEAKRHISRVAATAYNEQGVSLYDAIVPKSRDEEVLDGMLDEAVRALLAATSDVSSHTGRKFYILQDGQFSICCDRHPLSPAPNYAKYYMDDCVTPIPGTWTVTPSGGGTVEIVDGEGVTHEATFSYDNYKLGPDRHLTFDVPDFNSLMTEAFFKAVGMVLTYGVVASWLLERQSPRAEEYAGRGRNAMSEAITILYTRKKPART